MPSLPTYTKCSQLGCKNSRSKLNTFCMDHGGKNYTVGDERTAFKSMYQSSLWKQIRQTQLSKQPLCQACLLSGRVSQANHVDHLFAWASIGKAAFSHNVWQSLCMECHSVKTGLEKQGIYRHYVEPLKDYTINDYQYVVKNQ